MVKFMVLRVETPVMYWVRMQNMDMAKMYQKLVLGMARHFAKSEARKQLDVLERGKLVAAAGSDGVYRMSRLERLVYRARAQMQQLDMVEVFAVDWGERETVEPFDLSSLPDQLGVDVFPPAATRLVVAGIVAQDMDRNWGVQASMYVSSMMEGQGEKEVVCREQHPVGGQMPSEGQAADPSQVCLHIRDCLLIGGGGDRHHQHGAAVQSG